MSDLFTPRQVARAIGVSESSVKRWCDRGLIPTVRTAGGHRRVTMEGVMGFLRTGEHRLLVPEALGLPAPSSTGSRGLDRSRALLREALVEGNAAVCRQVIFDLFAAGHPVSVICDNVLARAFHEIGAGWECGDVQVWQERRACEIAVRALHELQHAVPAPEPGAPVAVGGTAEGDQYWLPTTMVELTLRECGWRAVSLGTSLPFTTMRTAIDMVRPALFWLSVSHIADLDSFVPQCRDLYEAAVAQGAAFVVGGRALDDSIRPQLQYSAFGDNLQHLVAFVQTLRGTRQLPQ